MNDTTTKCPDCEGTGQVDGDECARCEGSGHDIEAELGIEAALEADTPMGLDDDGARFGDDEPGDIDSDFGFDPYAGGPESTYEPCDDGDYFGDE